MKKVKLGIAVGALTVATAGTVVYASGTDDVGEALVGYDEVPALSTPGKGKFSLRKVRFTGELEYELSYAGLESPVTQAHIHFGNVGQNGPITVFLCTNLGNGPAGTQLCPAAPGTIEGSIDAADVLGNAAAQGLAAGEFDELVRAIKAGAMYVNVHSTGRPGGEIRAQVQLARRH